mgnify:CR=1 FL=1
MSWLIIMETEKAGKRQSAVLSCGFAWSQDAPSGKSLYRMLCKRMNVEDTQEYVVRLKKKAVYFPREIFDETETVVIDGRKFPVPGDTYTYLQKYYGEDYQEKVLDNYTVKLSEMVSARIRFEDYFQEVGSQKSLIRKRSRARRKQGHANQKKEYLNWSWNYVKFCASKIELEKYYLDNKEYIINLYKIKIIRLWKKFLSHIQRLW